MKTTAKDNRDLSVWLCEYERIASFHSVSGYEKHGFVCYENFMEFLQTLQEQGYKFQ